MEQQTPYQSPESNPHLGGQEPALPTGRPAVPKVFGIIHIVYGALGLLGGLIGYASINFLNTIASELGDQELLQMEAAFEAYYPYIIASFVVSAILSVLLIIAGIYLVKYRIIGRTMSLVWAVIYCVWNIGFLIFSRDATRDFEASFDQSGTFATGGSSGAEAVGMIFGVVIALIYPILCFIFLNSVKAKDSLK